MEETKYYDYDIYVQCFQCKHILGRKSYYWGNNKHEETRTICPKCGAYKNLVNVSARKVVTRRFGFLNTYKGESYRYEIAGQLSKNSKPICEYCGKVNCACGASQERRKYWNMKELFFGVIQKVFEL